MVRIDELSQETSAVAVRMSWKSVDVLEAVGEARQFAVEQGKKLRQDLSEEFKEELVVVRAVQGMH